MLSSVTPALIERLQVFRSSRSYAGMTRTQHPVPSSELVGPKPMVKKQMRYVVFAYNRLKSRYLVVCLLNSFKSEEGELRSACYWVNHAQ